MPPSSNAHNLPASPTRCEGVCLASGAFSVHVREICGASQEGASLVQARIAAEYVSMRTSKAAIAAMERNLQRLKKQDQQAVKTLSGRTEIDFGRDRGTNRSKMQRRVHSQSLDHMVRGRK